MTMMTMTRRVTGTGRTRVKASVYQFRATGTQRLIAGGEKVRENEGLKKAWSREIRGWEGKNVSKNVSTVDQGNN